MRTLPLIVSVLALSACATADAVDVPSSAAPASSAASTIQLMSADEVRSAYKKHAVLAQYYRWYQLYENDDSQIANALDILDTDVFIKSGLGEAKGHDAYAKRVAGLPKAWDNSHQVQDVNVTLNADGTADLRANIVYLNRGLLPDGEVRTANLTYNTKLKPGAALLPKFTSVEITQNSDSRGVPFVAAYPHNRVRSLLHYWLALIENPGRDADPFHELLADGYQLNFSTGAIDSFDKFKAWYNGPASTVAASTHAITSFSVSETGPNMFKMVAEMDWNGILPNGNELVARTRHTWNVVDNPADRFAKIKTMNVEILVPFQPRPKP